MRKQKSSTTTKKLSIDKQTIRLLTSDEARGVAGGVLSSLGRVCID